MNVKRLMVIVLVLGIVFLNGCKDEEVQVSVPSATKVTTTSVEESTTEPETTTSVETTTAVSTTTKATSKVVTTAKVTTTTTVATTAANGTYLNIEQEMLSLVNAERAKVGKNALVLSDGLNSCARVRAKELVESFAHTRPDGTECYTVFDTFGVTYKAAGENIAYGQTSVSNVMNSWMNSPGHKANILSENCDFNQMGCAGYSYNGRIYWVQIFIYAR